MISLSKRLYDTFLRSTPYPAALQLLVSLVFVAVPLSALFSQPGELIAAPDGHFWIASALLGSVLLALWLVPVRRLPTWAIVVYLASQCALVVAANTLLPLQIFDYVYLTIVVQAITVTRLWIWIPLAVGVWFTWSGTLLIASAGVIEWLKLNLALAFPTTCIIIAAVVYARQLRRQEQTQQLFEQVQQRYLETTSALRDMQQRFMLEERSRLTQTVANEVQAALARSEQTVGQAISQAQTNLARVQSTVTQTRAAAGVAVERLRTAIASLRRNEFDSSPAPMAVSIALPGNQRDDNVVSAVSATVLTWVLPSVFVVLATILTLLQHEFAIEALIPVVLCGSVLLGLTVTTQRVKHAFWLHAGFVGQAVAVIGMALLTQTLPLLLGLLLVIWQIATRLSLPHVIVFLTGLPTSLAIVISRAMPEQLQLENILIFGAACLIVGVPTLLARRQLRRMRNVEQQVAQLSSEMERQTSEVRMLAIAAERNRLAREFHDDLGNKLMLIHLQLQLAEELAAEDPGAALEELQKSRETMRGAWRSVLATADATLPVDGTSLADGLHELVLQCSRCTNAVIELDADDDYSALAPTLAATVYRVVQEGLTNACKHAQPERIVVQVTLDENLVTVTVSNHESAERHDVQTPHTASPVEGPEGRSTGSRANLNSWGSYGLAGLRERAEIHGGGFEAGPLVGGGFRVRMVLPVEL
jgi:signal transduction histidine kinase